MGRNSALQDVKNPSNKRNETLSWSCIYTADFFECNFFDKNGCGKVAYIQYWFSLW